MLYICWFAIIYFLGLSHVILLNLHLHTTLFCTHTQIHILFSLTKFGFGTAKIKIYRPGTVKMPDGSEVKWEDGASAMDMDMGLLCVVMGAAKATPGM